MQKLIKYSLAIFIIINFFYCLSGVIHFPLASIDEISIWMMKAKIFYLDGLLPINQFNSMQFSHPQYPVLLPLLFFGISKLIGSFNEVILLLIYPFIYLLIVFLCYKTLKLLNFSENVALLYAYIFSMLSPLLAMGGRLHAGEADIFIVLAGWLIVLFYNYYSKHAANKWLIYILITIIVASGIKTEGAFLSVIYLFIPISKTKKFTFFTLSLLPLALWEIFVKSASVNSDLSFFIPGIISLFNRSVLIIYFTLREMLNIKNWYIFWPLFGLSFFLKKNIKSTISNNLLPAFGIIVLLFVFNYLFSILDPRVYVASSADRVLMQLSAFYFPIFAYNTRGLLANINIKST